MGGGGWEKCLRGGMRGCRVGQATIGAWKRGWGWRLEKVLGTFDGQGWLGKVLARLHARLPVGLGWDWCLEIALGRSMENLFGVFLPRTAWKK